MTAPSWLWSALLALQEVLVFLLILVILRRPREPRAMLAWILALLLLPFVGIVLYLVLGEPRKRRHRRRRRRRRAEVLRSLKATDSGERQWSPEEVPATPEERRLQRLARRLEAFPECPGNEVTIYQEAEETYLAKRRAIAEARSHVHLEYYIMRPDETGLEIRDTLIDRARQGVQCRLLLDYIGCWWLPRSFVQPMTEAGVEVAFALPVLPLRWRWRVNYRNHRKILVVDGVTGFTGSQNIGNEYSGRLARFGPWRDTHMKIVGPAVQHLQEIFVQDWHYSTRRKLVSEDYFPESEASGDHVVQLVPSGPDQHSAVMHQLLFAAMSLAQESICIITPYFVPDSAMVLAFQSAAYRGIQVRLIIPSCSDHRWVLWAGRSYYGELLRAGVEIFEHDSTMLHSKVMIVDERWAMVGSANMDERSFRINFELTTLLYSDAIARELFRDFESLRSSSRRIARADVTDRSLKDSLITGLARLSSPLL